MSDLTMSDLRRDKNKLDKDIDTLTADIGIMAAEVASGNQGQGQAAAGGPVLDALKRLMEQVTDIQLRQEYMVLPRVIRLAEKCVFVLLDQAGLPIGTGFFIEPHVAITAKHNFPLGLKIGDKSFATCSLSDNTFELQVTEISPRHDVIKLQSMDIHDHLPIYMHPSKDNLQGRELVLCTYQIGIKKHLPSSFKATLGTVKASVTKVSANNSYVVYKSTSWAGDSGGALLLYDDSVVAMHLDMVNSFKEASEKSSVMEDRMQAMEGSLSELIAGSHLGCVAITSEVFGQPL